MQCIKNLFYYLILIISLLCLLLFAPMNRRWSFWPVLFSLGLLFSICLQAYFILPYTPLVKEKVATALSNQVDKKAIVSIIIAHVYMKNRNAQAFLDMAKHAAPDVIWSWKQAHVGKILCSLYKPAMTSRVLIFSGFKTIDSPDAFYKQV